MSDNIQSFVFSGMKYKIFEQPQKSEFRKVCYDEAQARISYSTSHDTDYAIPLLICT